MTTDTSESGLERIVHDALLGFTLQDNLCRTRHSAGAAEDCQEVRGGN